MEYLINRFLQVINNYGGIIKTAIKKVDNETYELQLFDMPASLDMELVNAELVDYEEEIIFDKRGRAQGTELVKHSYPVCTPIHHKDHYCLMVTLDKQDYSRRLIAIDSAIRRYLRKHRHI